MTLEELARKIHDLENRIKNIENDQTMGEHASLLPLLENHAKICTDFNGFKMLHSNAGNSIDPDNLDRDNLFYQDTITIQCSCNQPDAIWVLCIGGQFNVSFLQQYLEMINKKYKINRPKINNITDRIELNEPTN